MVTYDLFGGVSLVPEKKLPGAAHQGDGQLWLEKWLVKAVVGQDGGREPATLPDSARPIG
jgi:hypothetical protein